MTATDRSLTDLVSLVASQNPTLSDSECRAIAEMRLMSDRYFKPRRRWNGTPVADGSTRPDEPVRPDRDGGFTAG